MGAYSFASLNGDKGSLWTLFFSSSFTNLTRYTADTFLYKLYRLTFLIKSYIMFYGMHVSKFVSPGPS